MARPKGNPPTSHARNVGGRPRVEIDWAVFDALCGVQCTLAEIAGHFGCSERTIERAVTEKWAKGFVDYYREKAGRGAIALRRKQYSVALNGNVTMLIWLGKQRLGQTDKQVNELTGKDGSPLATTQIHLHMGDNGRGIAPPVTNGNGHRGR
jgi:hypothetical protein